GGGRFRPPAVLRPAGVVVLADRARVLPDRLPQPAGGAAELVLGVLELPARGEDHPRRRRSFRYKITNASHAELRLGWRIPAPGIAQRTRDRRDDRHRDAQLVDRAGG